MDKNPVKASQDLSTLAETFGVSCTSGSVGGHDAKDYRAPVTAARIAQDIPAPLTAVRPGHRPHPGPMPRTHVAAALPYLGVKP
jgi:hypothetical protein